MPLDDPVVQKILLISALYVFALAAFLGYQEISRVPPLLHTPLMSATNMISAISLVGSLVVAGARERTLSAPYAVWSDVLRAVRRLPVKSTRGWRELPSLDGSLERPANDPPRGRSKIRLLEELADFLRLAAQQRPLLIHLEELQWADGASWDALE